MLFVLTVVGLPKAEFQAELTSSLLETISSGDPSLACEIAHCLEKNNFPDIDVFKGGFSLDIPLLFEGDDFAFELIDSFTSSIQCVAANLLGSGTSSWSSSSLKGVGSNIKISM